MLTRFKVGDRATVYRVIAQQHNYKTSFDANGKLMRDGYSDKFIQHRDYWLDREVTVIPPNSNTPSLRMGWTVMVADKEGKQAIFYHEELERVS